jgi:hypothetical protein
MDGDPKIMKSLKLALLAAAPIMLVGATKVDYQPSRDPVYIVESIECVKATSGSSEDSIYLNQQPGGVRYPARTYSMSAGDKEDVGGVFYPTKPGKLVLYEADTFTGDDRIGEFKYDLREVSGTYTVTMDGDGAKYIVTVQVRR